MEGVVADHPNPIGLSEYLDLLRFAILGAYLNYSSEAEEPY
jgi:hypothetical protein